jgi:hypothetical protein
MVATKTTISAATTASTRAYDEKKNNYRQEEPH